MHDVNSLLSCSTYPGFGCLHLSTRRFPSYTSNMIFFDLPKRQRWKQTSASMWWTHAPLLVDLSFNLTAASLQTERRCRGIRLYAASPVSHWKHISARCSDSLINLLRFLDVDWWFSKTSNAQSDNSFRFINEMHLCLRSALLFLDKFWLTLITLADDTKSKVSTPHLRFNLPEKLSKQMSTNRNVSSSSRRHLSLLLLVRLFASLSLSLSSLFFSFSFSPVARSVCLCPLMMVD